MHQLKHQSWIERISIRHVMAAGILIRLLAAVFSKGYVFSDDHFEVVELAESWRNGFSLNTTGNPVYTVSLVYPGLHYLLFDACESLGITDPQQIMFITRLLHASFSVIAVYFAYRLSLRISPDRTSALIVAGLMALFWLFPFLSVHSLRETACIPFLLIGSYFIADPRLPVRSLVLSGFFLALACCLRLQAVFVPAGLGIFLLFQKERFSRSVIFGFAFIASFFLTQGLFDYFYYGNPLASTLAYFRYNANIANIGMYPQGPWYQYLGTLAGTFFVFPFLALAWGYFAGLRTSKNFALFFTASLLLFVFHSYYSNKQERFILPFVPYFIILGVIGYRHWYGRAGKPAWLRKATRFMLGWFLVLNTAGLLVVSFTYSKRSRVEVMDYLRKKNDTRNILVEFKKNYYTLPLYYLGKRLVYFTLSPEKSVGDLKNEIDTSVHPAPNYVIMLSNADFDARLQRLRELYPRLKPEATIAPSLVDKFVYRMNPRHNPNESIYIFRIQ